MSNRGYNRRSPPPAPKFAARTQSIDREKTCPLLLRVFYQNGEHHSGSDFAHKGREPENEVQIYTWKDATLQELSELLQEVLVAARQPDVGLSFAFVFPERNGRWIVKRLGTTYPNRWSELDRKTLAELGFTTGDYLDVAILSNKSTK